MPRSDAKTSQEKFFAFKKAFENIKIYREQKNFIAAYVLSFSVMEDRLRALYVVWYRGDFKEDPPSKKINSALSKITQELLRQKNISESLHNEINQEIKIRNELLHAALWNLDAFQEEAVNRVVKIARDIDKALKKSIKSI